MYRTRLQTSPEFCNWLDPESSLKDTSPNKRRHVLRCCSVAASEDRLPEKRPNMTCTRISCAALLVCLTGTIAAQTAPPAAQTAPTPSLPQIDFSALVDGYFSFNNNHPASGFNTLRNFEVKA